MKNYSPIGRPNNFKKYNFRDRPLKARNFSGSVRNLVRPDQRSPKLAGAGRNSDCKQVVRRLLKIFRNDHLWPKICPGRTESDPPRRGKSKTGPSWKKFWLEIGLLGNIVPNLKSARPFGNSSTLLILSIFAKFL